LCIVQIKGKSVPSFREKVLLPHPDAFKIVLFLEAKRSTQHFHNKNTSNAQHFHNKYNNPTTFTQHSYNKCTTFIGFDGGMGLVRSGGAETHILVSENAQPVSGLHKDQQREVGTFWSV